MHARPHHSGKTAIPTDARVQLKTSNGMRYNWARKGQAFLSQACGHKCLHRPRYPTEHRPLPTHNGISLCWSRNFGNSKLLYFVHQIEVGDRHICLALAASVVLLLSHLFQNGAGRFRSQEVVIRWAGATEFRRRRTWSLHR